VRRLPPRWRVRRCGLCTARPDRCPAGRARSVARSRSQAQSMP
jgi:hypothetical protein